MTKYLILLLTFGFLIIIGVILFRVFYFASVSEFYPFAYLPELNLSQQPNFLANRLLNKILPNQSEVPDPDEQMILGKYQRYPLNAPKQTTSIVAVESNLNNFPNFLAWSIEIDIDAWNFVWADSASSYYVTPISLVATPLVVLKGRFPRCRYFSIYSYVGIDRTDKGDKLFGQGISKDENNACNATHKDGNLKCQGFRDYEINPDKGSKNPFNDPTFVEGDDDFYTIYLKSPYYDGPMPQDPKINVLPLSMYGAKSALICYRIYSPFNPKSCSSKQYWNKVSFNTTGCDGNKRLEIVKNGGAVTTKYDKSSPCKLQDSVCYNQCIADKLGHSGEPDCLSYLGNNLYCVCNKPESKCYNVLDNIMKECTNGMGSINNFCASAPQKKVNDCIDLVDCEKFTDPTEKNQCTNYVASSNYQNCVGQKILASDLDDCYQYKDPNKICNMCTNYKEKLKDPNSCQTAYNKFATECDKETGFGNIDIDSYCLIKCGDLPGFVQPKPNYNPEYNFNTPPLDCSFNQCGVRYDCVKGNCFPVQNGRFTNPNCDNVCYYNPTETPQPNYCKNVNYNREDYTQTSTPGGVRPCNFKHNAQDCDLNAQKYKNIGEFGINSTPPEKIFRQAWVDLPQCFVKYNYTNYFIKLSSWNLQKRWKLSLLNSLQHSISNFTTKNPVNPNNNPIVENFGSDDDPGSSTENIVDCVASSFNGDNSFADITSCFEDLPDQIRDKTGRNHKEDETNPGNQCNSWVDPSTYYMIGAQFPVGKLPVPKDFKIGDGKDKDGNPHMKTYKVAPPYCSYYADRCKCEHHQTSLNNCCETSLGQLKCDGTPCFTVWQNKEYVFEGKAKPFVATANAGTVIPFPNPDATYLGCCTSYDPNSVYVIWFDAPTFPHTPGFENILRNNYDLRYFSIGHYGFNMTPSSQRPVFSDLVDFEIMTKCVSYTDEYTGKKIEGRRACVVLSTFEQYEYLKNYNLWNDDNLNFLNWGKVQMDAGSPDVSGLHPTKKKGGGLAKNLLNYSHIPKKGILLMRQLFPSPDFKESIESFSSNDCLKNVEKKVQTKFEKGNMLQPREIPRYCNPGPSVVSKYDVASDPKNPNQTVCDAYELDPCCLCKNVLMNCKNYYPRCEQVKICDIEKYGMAFWDRYFTSLPYKYDSKPIPPPPIPTTTTYPPTTTTYPPTTTTYPPTTDLKQKFTTKFFNYLKRIICTFCEKANESKKLTIPPYYDSVPSMIDNNAYGIRDKIMLFIDNLFQSPNKDFTENSINDFKFPYDKNYNIYVTLLKNAGLYVVIMNCIDEKQIKVLFDAINDYELTDKECYEKIIEQKSNDVIDTFTQFIVIGGTKDYRSSQRTKVVTCAQPSPPTVDLKEKFTNKFLNNITNSICEFASKANSNENLPHPPFLDYDPSIMKNDKYNIYNNIIKFIDNVFKNPVGITEKTLENFDFPLEHGIYRSLMKNGARYVVVMNCNNTTKINEILKTIDDFDLSEQDCYDRIIKKMNVPSITTFGQKVITPIYIDFKRGSCAYRTEVKNCNEKFSFLNKKKTQW